MTRHTLSASGRDNLPFELLVSLKGGVSKHSDAQQARARIPCFMLGKNSFRFRRGLVWNVALLSKRTVLCGPFCGRLPFCGSIDAVRDADSSKDR